MIYEYAIEPELVVAWGKDRADYRYFIEQFGLGTPRMMSEFPKLKNWRRQFKQAASSADETNELPRITALFNLLKESLVHREGCDYDGTLTWLENTEAENARQEFRAILSMSNPRNHTKVLTPARVETSPLWRIEKQAYCPRQANDMAQLLAVLLSNCSEVHFIDPHFGPENAKWRRPLEAFLGVITANRACRPCIEQIMLHTSGEEGKADFAFFRQTCEDQLRPRIPAGIRLVLQRWKQRGGGEKLHERFVLTDLGGVKVGPGLDDGSQGENFEAMLLERNLYEKQWNDYVANPAFDRAEDPFEIVGSKGE